MQIGGLQPTSLVDYPGVVSAVLFTVGCNFRCPYCHNPELVLEEPERVLDTAEVLHFLESRIGKLQAVVITGGEPTMHDDLLEMMQTIREMGFLIKLDTNGTNPPMLMQAVNDGLTQYVAMDIKSPLSKYSATVGAAVDISAIAQSIDFLKKDSVEYEFRTTIVRSQLSPEDVLDIGKDIAGAKRYYLQQFSPAKTLHPLFRKKLSYSRQELDTMAESLAPFVDYCGVRI